MLQFGRCVFSIQENSRTLQELDMRSGRAIQERQECGHKPEMRLTKAFVFNSDYTRIIQELMACQKT